MYLCMHASVSVVFMQHFLVHCTYDPPAFKDQLNYQQVKSVSYMFLLL